MEARTVSRNGRRPGIRNILTFLVVYGLALFLFAYGVKCIITGTGKLTEPGKYVMGSYYLAPVSGQAAVSAGAGYIALSVAASLASFRRCDVRSMFAWVICFAGFFVFLGITFFFWHRAHELRIR
jgi:hypothetical protein